METTTVVAALEEILTLEPALLASVGIEPAAGIGAMVVPLCVATDVVAADCPEVTVARLEDST